MNRAPTKSMERSVKRTAVAMIMLAMLGGPALAQPAIDSNVDRPWAKGIPQPKQEKAFEREPTTRVLS